MKRSTLSARTWPLVSRICPRIAGVCSLIRRLDRAAACVAEASKAWIRSSCAANTLKRKSTAMNMARARPRGLATEMRSRRRRRGPRGAFPRLAPGPDREDSGSTDPLSACRPAALSGLARFGAPLRRARATLGGAWLRSAGRRGAEPRSDVRWRHRAPGRRDLRTRPTGATRRPGGPGTLVLVSWSRFTSSTWSGSGWPWAGRSRLGSGWRSVLRLTRVAAPPVCAGALTARRASSSSAAFCFVALGLATGVGLVTTGKARDRLAGWAVPETLPVLMSM